ncbi:hypothetical protein B0H17DRAFT_1045950 [Mycena rosella]|uniref:Uncharacterized protein n=1 Tax=Mycena rosella TaxID=1033263 RepID=A0AAD7GM30_MYCRO|nr:hypothetical protein B0H17DRAFT_1045950 [Mycena rosella]
MLHMALPICAMSVRGISSWPACRSISRAGSQPLTPVYTSVQLASPSSTPSAASSQSRSPHKPSQAHPLLPIFKPMSRKPKHMLSSSLDIRSYLAFSLWFSCSFCYPVVDRYRPAVKAFLLSAPSPRLPSQPPDRPRSSSISSSEDDTTCRHSDNVQPSRRSTICTVSRCVMAYPR